MLQLHKNKTLRLFLIKLALFQFIYNMKLCFYSNRTIIKMNSVSDGI